MVERPWVAGNSPQEYRSEHSSVAARATMSAFEMAKDSAYRWISASASKCNLAWKRQAETSTAKNDQMHAERRLVRNYSLTLCGHLDKNFAAGAAVAAPLDADDEPFHTAFWSLRS